MTLTFYEKTDTVAAKNKPNHIVIVREHDKRTEAFFENGVLWSIYQPEITPWIPRSHYKNSKLKEVELCRHLAYSEMCPTCHPEYEPYRFWELIKND